MPSDIEVTKQALERIEAVTDDEKALKQIAMERRQIERKLYQQPPLTQPLPPQQQ